MDIDNQSPWAATAIPMWTLARKRQPVLVVKTGYQWNEQGNLQPLTETDIPLEITERYYNDDPERHSLQADLDLVPFKNGFELLVTGTAHFAKPVEMFEVSVALLDAGNVPGWQKSLRIIGPHSWQRNALGWVPGKSTPIESLPLQYEYAFGGQHPDNPAKNNQNNPAGLGDHAEVGSPLPQIQQPPLITKKHSKPAPAGFGPLARHWQPRLETQSALNDVAAQKGACPYPFMVDNSLYNSAPADQQFTAAPDYGTKLQLKNLDKQQPLQTIDLPSAQPTAKLSDGQPIPLVWDTLLVNTDKKQLFQVWRGVVPVELIDMLNVGILLNEASLSQPKEAAV